MTSGAKAPEFFQPAMSRLKARPTKQRWKTRFVGRSFSCDEKAGSRIRTFRP